MMMNAGRVGIELWRIFWAKAPALWLSIALATHRVTLPWY